MAKRKDRFDYKAPQDFEPEAVIAEEPEPVMVEEPPRPVNPNRKPSLSEIRGPLFVAELFSKSVFVSTKGSDYSGNGTVERPFRTTRQGLTRAKALGPERCKAVVLIDITPQGF